MQLMLFQIILLFIPIVLGLTYNIQNLFFSVINFWGDSTSLELLISSYISNGRVVSLICGVLISLIIYKGIVSFNAQRYFNKGNKYLTYGYWFYWIAANIFRFEKISLVNLPIYMQYLLVINETFPVLEADQSFISEESSIKEIEVEIKKIMEVDSGKQLNLVLIDTYEINQNELPLTKIGLPTIILKSVNQVDGNRTTNPEFIKKVRENTNYYSRKFKRINIFSTTNTNHTKAIAKQCFQNSGRTGFKEVVVYQADNKDYKFKNSYKII